MLLSGRVLDPPLLRPVYGNSLLGVIYSRFDGSWRYLVRRLILCFLCTSEDLMRIFDRVAYLPYALAADTLSSDTNVQASITYPFTSPLYSQTTWPPIVSGCHGSSPFDCWYLFIGDWGDWGSGVSGLLALSPPQYISTKASSPSP